MISIIITSFKEPNTIGKAIKCVADRMYSGIEGEFEVIQASPDDETLQAGQSAVIELPKDFEYHQIKDPLKGKPYGLNMALQAAKGDILILTDGDAYFAPQAIKELLKPFTNKRIAATTGQPIADNPRETLWGYFGSFFASVADRKRRDISEKIEEGYYVCTKSYLPLSGYIIAMRNIGITLQPRLLTEDEYISRKIVALGYLEAYCPQAQVYAKFPQSLKDYLSQKVRTTAGFKQVNSLMKFENTDYSLPPERSFRKELAYFWYPFAHAKNLKEHLWSLLLFPLRFLVWIAIIRAKIVRKELYKDTGWQRIESTK